MNSFRPFAATKQDRERAQERRIPPFVDDSIRREPDLEHKFPSISGLCRCDKLLSRADEGDYIAYVTVKNGGLRHLVALLKVWKKFASHQAAARWYQEQKLALPSNCVVAGNPPLSLEMVSFKSGRKSHRAWAKTYEDRSENHPQFLVCKPVLKPELHVPVEVPEDVFGRRFPATRNPPEISKDEFGELKRLFAANARRRRR